MKVKSESEVTQSYLTLSDPMDCSLRGSSVHGIFQARVLEWGAIAFSDKPEELKPNTLKYQVGNVNYLMSQQRWKECYGEINIYHPKTDTHWFFNSTPLT